MPKAPLSVNEARARIIDALALMPLEATPLTEAGGRVLGEDTTAKLTNPPADQSAMDGYAVRCADVATVPTRLKLAGESAAGAPFDKALEAGFCVHISTGANLPQGADAIVIVENTRQDGETIEILEPPKRGQFIRRQGQDFQTGDALLQAGRWLDGRHLGLLAAAGYDRIKTRRPPRIVIAATGSELVEIGASPTASQIVSSNSIMIAEMVRKMGGEAVTLPPIPDLESALIDATAAPIHDADLLILTGGASVGKHDIVANMMRHSQGLDFWRIAMRPGKPMIFGHIGTGKIGENKTPMLGLPGNPVSCGVCTLIFVRAAIRAMLGLNPAPKTRQMQLGANIEANDEREEYMRGHIQGNIFIPFTAQDSAKIKDFAQADALMIRPANAEAIEAGAMVEIIPLDDA